MADSHMATSGVVSDSAGTLRVGELSQDEAPRLLRALAVLETVPLPVSLRWLVLHARIWLSSAQVKMVSLLGTLIPQTSPSEWDIMMACLAPVEIVVL
jgi:hypothetical protein